MVERTSSEVAVTDGLWVVIADVDEDWGK